MSEHCGRATRKLDLQSDGMSNGSEPAVGGARESAATQMSRRTPAGANQRGAVDRLPTYPLETLG